MSDEEVLSREMARRMSACRRHDVRQVAAGKQAPTAARVHVGRDYRLSSVTLTHILLLSSHNMPTGLS